MIENANGVAWVKDLEGRFVLVNGYTEQVLGLPRERILGRTVFDLFPPDQARDYAANDRQVLTSGAPIDVEECVRLDDAVYWFASRKFPLRNTEGQVYALGALCLDISVRIEAERALRESETRGAARREAEAAQTRARTEAERLAQAKGELLANLSRAIRPPLAALLGFATLGSRECAEPRIQDYFDRILDAGGRLRDIVDEIPETPQTDWPRADDRAERPG